MTFGFKSKEDFKLEEVKKAIEEKTEFKVGKVVKQP